MLDQDRTRETLGTLKRFVEDMEKDIRDPETACIEMIFCATNTKGQLRRVSMACGQTSIARHRAMALAILERLAEMEREIGEAVDLQQKEVAHVH